MALTQMQIIQSLGEAMAWFEREIGWGVPPTELPHLCGRIGELYAALITNGQMATNVNQSGYDVVSSLGQKVSVKTTAMMSGNGNFTFNPNTLSLVDRVILLRLNTEEMQIETLLDCTIEEARTHMKGAEGAKFTISISRLLTYNTPKTKVKIVNEVAYKNLLIRELESGTIEVEQEGELLIPAKPELRRICFELGVDALNENGNERNTRQLGSLIIKTIKGKR